MIFFYFPNFVREIIFEATDPKNEIIYYDNALNKFLSASKICNKNLSIKNFEKKFNQFFIKKFYRTNNCKVWWKKPLFLPGGKIIIPFSWLKTEKSYSNFKKCYKSQFMHMKIGIFSNILLRIKVLKQFYLYL